MQDEGACRHATNLSAKRPQTVNNPQKRPRDEDMVLPPKKALLRTLSFPLNGVLTRDQKMPPQEVLQEKEKHILLWKKSLGTGPSPLANIEIPSQEVLPKMPAGCPISDPAQGSTTSPEAEVFAIVKILDEVSDGAFCDKEQIRRICKATGVDSADINSQTLQKVAEKCEEYNAEFKEYEAQFKDTEELLDQSLKAMQQNPASLQENQALVSAKIAWALASGRPEHMFEALSFISRKCNCTLVCPNEGCGEKVPAHAFKEHEGSCIHAEIKCLCNFAGSREHVSCCWRGHPKYMQKHIEETHKSVRMVCVELKQRGAVAQAAFLHSVGRVVIVDGVVARNTCWVCLREMKFGDVSFFLLHYMWLDNDGKVNFVALIFGVKQEAVKIGHHFLNPDNTVFFTHTISPSYLKDFNVMSTKIEKLAKPPGCPEGINVAKHWQDRPPDTFAKIGDGKDGRRAFRIVCQVQLDPSRL